MFSLFNGIRLLFLLVASIAAWAWIGTVLSYLIGDYDAARTCAIVAILFSVAASTVSDRIMKDG